LHVAVKRKRAVMEMGNGAAPASSPSSITPTTPTVTIGGVTSNTVTIAVQ
jgi:hypothetical protein